MKPVLSMSLLCSGRSETTEKCLQSLSEIRKKIDSEIVVVDTGCKEDVRDIVEKYADKVIEFKWCDDFAKARNAGLEECTGEWFFFIDDDEWFSDVTPIVDFFVSGEYKKYGCACYKVRNYTDHAGTRYEDTWAGRMAKLDSDTHFVSRIHEFLVPVRLPEKLIDAYANHYGYIFDSNTELYAHSKRNISLLHEMMEEEPGELRWPVQLAQEYKGINDYTSMIELCASELDKIKDQDNSNSNKHRACFYIGMVWAYDGRCQWKEVISLCRTYLNDRRNTDLCNARLNLYCAVACYNTKDYTKAAHYAIKYIELYRSWKGQPDYDIKFKSVDTLLTHDVFSDGLYNMSLKIDILSELKSKKVKNAYKYIKKLETKYPDEMILAISKQFVDYISESDYDNRFPDVAKFLFGKGNLRDACLLEMQSIEEGNPEGFDHLIDVFSSVDSKHPYITYIKIRKCDKDGTDKSKMEELYKDLFEKLVDIFDLNRRAWTIAEKYGLDIGKYFRSMPFYRWQQAVDNLFAEDSDDNKEKDKHRKRISDSADFVAKYLADEETRKEYFELKFREYWLNEETYEKPKDEKNGLKPEDREDSKSAEDDEKSDDIDKQRELTYREIQKDLLPYISANILLFEKVYQPDVINGEMEFVEPSCRLSIELLKVLSTMDKRKATENVSMLEKCIGIYEPMDGVVKKYIKLYAEERKKELSKGLEENK